MSVSKFGTTDAEWLAEEVLDALLEDGAHGALTASYSRVELVRASRGALDADRSFHAEEPRVEEEQVFTLAARVTMTAGQRTIDNSAIPSSFARHDAERIARHLGVKGIAPRQLALDRMEDSCHRLDQRCHRGLETFLELGHEHGLLPPGEIRFHA